MHAVPPFNKQEAKYASICLRFLPLSGARDYIFFSSTPRILPCWIFSKLHSEPGSAKHHRLFKPRLCLALSGVIYSTTKSLWLAALAECAFQWFVVACFQFKQMAGAVTNTHGEEGPMPTCSASLIWFVSASGERHCGAPVISFSLSFFCVLLKYVKQLINDSDDNNSWYRVPPPGGSSFSAYSLFILTVLAFSICSRSFFWTYC